jgi:signal transduction histidine kinase
MSGFLLFGSAMFLQLSYSLAAGREKTLLNRAGRAEAMLERCRREAASMCTTRFEDFAAATPEGNLIRIYDSAGKLLYPTERIASNDFISFTRTQSSPTIFSKTRFEGIQYRLLSKSTRIGTEDLQIVIAGQLKDNALILRQFRMGLLWATPFFLALCAISGYLMGKRALSPVSELALSARSVTLGNLTDRLPIANTGDEVQDLAETCNSLLDRLESTARQVARFTADASHELRSPVSYIYTLSESAIRNQDLDAESAEAFIEIARECSEATKLLDDMLTLARFDAGHTDASLCRLDLSELLSETCDKARPFAAVKHHTIMLQTPNKQPIWVMGDPLRLRRLFWILLDNAIKYTPPRGSIDVTLGTRGSEAVVSVRDTGIGIPKSEISDIFRRFYRVDKARSVTEGTGLGLSIAKWIAEIHRTELSVESSENSGSTFHISLRIA